MGKIIKVDDQGYFVETEDDFDKERPYVFVLSDGRIIRVKAFVKEGCVHQVTSYEIVIDDNSDYMSLLNVAVIKGWYYAYELDQISDPFD